ncbi:MAG: methylenetetrahydrofolate reductase [NAD(P)H] [Akkermansia sp.]|nr:methylenetetrahydrofolate reductase [NAD(P)H] [Akkermansia sp.]
MHLKEKLQSCNGPSLSFEFFPPKNEQAATTLYNTIQELEPYQPSFVSVTYGAGGSNRELTRDVAIKIQQQTSIPTVAHLTCVGHTRKEIWDILDQYAQAGVKAVLALRGDPPHGTVNYNHSADEFQHAADLVAFIRKYNDSGNHPDPQGFAIGVAGFVEGHPATPNRLKEMEYLKAKVDAGADYICTQLFFDNHNFFDFRERCLLAGINIPILAGIMPITSISGMYRMAELSGGTCFPARLLKAIKRAGDDLTAIQEVGIQYASSQCAELLDNNVAGIHFYTLNKSLATREIYRNLGLKNSRQLLINSKNN